MIFADQEDRNRLQPCYMDRGDEVHGNDRARSTLDIREQLVRIDKMQAELAKSQVEIPKVQAEISKIQAEIGKIALNTRLAPYTMLLAGAGATAALIAATITLTKLFLG